MHHALHVLDASVSFGESGTVGEERIRKCRPVVHSCQLVRTLLLLRVDLFTQFVEVHFEN